ncbi:right-handed parallel beta-helix repeat-containing protein [Congregibacter litoralis]|uniref:Right handed beta helix region n=1 Tax=Congregibacter litoralis KT71 TaxID=314285 RepID=A4A571_9GAMM|nr:right-handed parallel beta-helix repeat-containing protein [Congregibacter litoralis]EAQ98942.2 Right handed beta helix region [Congregibacter litoralis KT71]
MSAFRLKTTLFFYLSVYGLATPLHGAASVTAAPTESVTLRVATAAALYAAVRGASGDQKTVISLADGVYRLSNALRIGVDNVTIRSDSDDPAKVIIAGNGMRQTAGVDNLIEVSGKGVALIGLTLREAGNHLIQLRGERDADHFRLLNCVLQDSYEQLLKVSGASEGAVSADFGVVRNSRFEYTADLGPNFYIGGIDMHGGKNWLIERNHFRNIASPADAVAEFAIHLWTGSADNVVRDNVIINSDRGIGFGLGDQWFRHNRAGEITGNVILHLRPSDPFADVGIALENSPGTLINDNFVYLTHNYPNGIEYRFQGTTGVLITGNVTNKAIKARDGAEGLPDGNQTGSITRLGIDSAALMLRELHRRFVEQD